MTETLYRKYRPQTFAEVVGQEYIKHTIQNQLKHGKLAHAYLFCGMRGIGKTTLARLLAKAVNCEKRKSNSDEPCNSCESCKEITAGNSLDLIEIDAASNRRIDDIREIREHIPYGPAKAHYKVVIIDEVHMLTPEAFNALLKTLEEPPVHVIFILATTEVHKLPDTIISRCQRFDFKRLSASDIKKRLITLTKLEEVSVDDRTLGEIAQLSGGSTRDAEGYLGKLISLGEKKITQEQASLILPYSDINTTIKFLEHLVKQEGREAVELLNKFLEEGGELNYFYHQILELLRKMLLIKLGGQLPNYSVLELDEKHETNLKNLTSEISHSRLQSIIGIWLTAENNWRGSEIIQLPLELAIVSICEEKNGSNSKITTPTTLNEKPKASILTDTISSNSLTVEEIAKRWPEIIAKLREFNHSLSFILSIAKPAKLEGKTLTISFQYKLHQERIQDPKIRKIIEQTIQDVLAAEIIIKSIIDQTDTGSGDLLSSVLNTFGGQVVE